MKLNFFTKAIGMTTMLGLLAPTVTFAQTATHHDKIAKDALAADPAKPVSVIVQFKSSDEFEQDLSVWTAQGTAGKHFHHLKAMATQLSPAALQLLAADPNVAYISLDRPVRARQTSTTGAEFTTEPINAPGVWSQGYDGTGVGVAVIDSGITNVPDLGPAAKGPSRIVYNQSFLASTATLVGPAATNDQYGHGTHVSGLIAGNGKNSTGGTNFRTFTGAAPNANLINLRVLDGNGQGTDSAVIEAIETAIDLKNVYNIRVINLSLGRPITESYTLDPLCQEVEAAWQAGIVVVVAAGNDGRDQTFNSEGYGTIESPGNDPYALTVGAMNTKRTAVIGDDIIASYSSKGPSLIDDVAKPDLVAPGNLVTSLKFPGALIPTESPLFVTLHSFYITGGDTKVSPVYYPLSGTSMAAGVVSGAVALLLQAQPQLTPDAVKASLMRNASHSSFPQVSSVTDATSGITYTSHYDLFTVGAGYLDIRAALNDTSNNVSMPAGAALSPTAVFNATTGNTTLAANRTFLWGSTALLTSDRTFLWGAAALLGDFSVYGPNAFVSQPSATAATLASDRTFLWGAETPLAADRTFLWGATAATLAADRTFLWGATAATLAADRTFLWGASTTVASDRTFLWGASVPFEY